MEKRNTDLHKSLVEKNEEISKLNYEITEQTIKLNEKDELEMTLRET